MDNFWELPRKIQGSAQRHSWSRETAAIVGVVLRHGRASGPYAPEASGPAPQQQGALLWEAWELPRLYPGSVSLSEAKAAVGGAKEAAQMLRRRVDRGGTRGLPRRRRHYLVVLHRRTEILRFHVERSLSRGYKSFFVCGDSGDTRFVHFYRLIRN